tara:strand:- start:2720 stop:5218 length:2499 start_codon:yes stop_codon:yes gene_type:complete
MGIQESNIDIHFEKGMTMVLSEPEKSYKTGEEIAQISTETDNEHLLAKGYLLKAYSGFFLGLYKKSFELVNAAIPIFIHHNDLKNQAASYNTLGFIYNYFDDHEKRLEFNLKSLTIREQIKDHDGFIRSLNNTGDSLLCLKRNHEALTYFLKCLSFTESDSLELLCITHSNIAETYHRINNFDECNKHLNLSTEYAKQINNEDIIINNILIQGKVFNSQGKFIKTIELLQNVLASKYKKAKEDISDLHKIISIAYKGLNNYQKSLENINKHFALKNDLNKEIQKKDLKSLSFREEINKLQDRAETLESLVKTRTKELKNALDSEKIISYFSRELNETLSLDDALWMTVKNVISKIYLEDCVIYLVDFDKNVLIQKAAYGPKNIDYREIHNPIEIPIGKGVVGTVASTGIHELIPDTKKEDKYIVDDNLRLSELAVPIFYKKKVIGVIDSENTVLNFFNERHLYLFKRISSLLESHYNRLVEQEIKQNLQDKIIALNNNLEQEINEKTKENTELNHRILDQDKKVIIGEIATIIAHELNTPLASIKAGSEAIVFLFNRLLSMQLKKPMNPKELEFIVRHAVQGPSKDVNNERTVLKKKTNEIRDTSKSLGFSFDDASILLMAKLNINRSKDLIELAKIEHIEYVLNLLHDINSIYKFNHSLVKMVKRTHNSISNLKTLVLSDEEKIKKVTTLISTFNGLQQYINMHYPKTIISTEIDKMLKILAFDFQTIQLWSNIAHLILENCSFNSPPIIKFNSFHEDSQIGITIKCSTTAIKTKLFDDEILNYRFSNKLNSKTTLKLNIIKTILDDHNAYLKCTRDDNEIIINLFFNGLN